jgi:hypothetical protein
MLKRLRLKICIFLSSFLLLNFHRQIIIIIVIIKGTFNSFLSLLSLINFARFQLPAGVGEMPNAPTGDLLLVFELSLGVQKLLFSSSIYRWSLA